jgi:tetratricopeptide (TPR) repeat protein
LVARAKRVVAIEKDKRLCEYLRDHMDGVELIEGDAVEILEQPHFHIAPPYKVVSSCDKALQLCPNHLRALLCRGLVLLRLSRPAEALEGLARLLAEAPDHADALVACATALQSLNRENESIDSLQRALAAQPNHPRALTALGTKLLDRGEAAQAIAHFDRVLLVAL